MTTTQPYAEDRFLESWLATGDVNSSSAAAVPEELPERPLEAPLTPSLFRYPASPYPLE